LNPRDVTLVEGLPVMTMERTISDLIEDVGDLSLVADALRDASRRRDLNLERLRTLLSPLAHRNGLRKGDGAALLDRLMEIAGIDPEAVARRVAADASLGSRVAASYVKGLSNEDIARLVTTPEMQQAMHALQESIATTIRRSVGPQLADAYATVGRVSAEMVEDGGLDEVARRISAQVVNSDIMDILSRGWITALRSSIVIKPETLAANPEARKAVTRD